VADSPERIVLIGLPGAGKSTVGPILAQQLGWHFVDLDEAIETATGRSIAELFELRGEAEFRRLETRLTEGLASGPQTVLSVGGGWILHNRLPDALIVWLQVDPDEAIRRAGEHVNARPLLRPDPHARMKELLKERQHLYETADLHINTNGLTPDAVAVAVAVAVEKYGHN
jgi:shikimate kinase